MCGRFFAALTAAIIAAFAATAVAAQEPLKIGMSLPLSPLRCTRDQRRGQFSEGALTQSDEVDGIDCTGVEVDLPEIDDFSRTWRQVEVDRIFARLVDEKRPDLVHVNHLTRLSLGMLDVLKKRGIPVLLTLHDYWMQCARGVRCPPTKSWCSPCSPSLALESWLVAGWAHGSAG